MKGSNIFGKAKHVKAIHFLLGETVSIRELEICYDLIKDYLKDGMLKNKYLNIPNFGGLYVVDRLKYKSPLVKNQTFLVKKIKLALADNIKNIFI